MWNSSLPTEKITPWFLRFCSSDLNWGEIKPCWSWRVCGLRYISPELAWTLGDEEAPALLSHEFANVQWTSLNKQGHILMKIIYFSHFFPSTILDGWLRDEEMISFTLLFAALASTVATDQERGTQCGAAAGWLNKCSVEKVLFF